MTSGRVQLASFYLLALAAVATVVPISAGIVRGPGGLAGLGLAVPLLVWNLMPYAVLTNTARRMSRSLTQALTVFTGSLLTAGAGVTILFDMVLHDAAEFGATVVFLPVLLGLGCGLTFFAGALLQPDDDPSVPL